MVLKSRSCFSLPFIFGAARLAKDAKRIEDDGVGKGSDYYLENCLQHRGVVLSAIISSTCCLEAFINELWSDMDEPNLEYSKAMPDSVRETMAEFCAWVLPEPQRIRFWPNTRLVTLLSRMRDWTNLGGRLRMLII